MESIFYDADFDLSSQYLQMDSDQEGPPPQDERMDFHQQIPHQQSDTTNSDQQDTPLLYTQLTVTINTADELYMFIRSGYITTHDLDG
jgi:hypothetical protein